MASAMAPAQNYTQTAAAPAQYYTLTAPAPAPYYTQPAVPYGQPVPYARRRPGLLWRGAPRVFSSQSDMNPSYTETSAVHYEYMQPINHDGSGLGVSRVFGPTFIGRPLETHADVQRRMQDRTDEMQRRRAAGWVPREFPTSFEDVEAQRLAASSTNVLDQPGTRPFQLNASAPPYVYDPTQMSTPAPQFTSTNVLDQPGTHPSRLNASAPSYDPTQTSTPPLLDATAPTSGAPIEPSTGMGAAPAPVLPASSPGFAASLIIVVRPRENNRWCFDDTSVCGSAVRVRQVRDEYTLPRLWPCML